MGIHGMPDKLFSVQIELEHMLLAVELKFPLFQRTFPVPKQLQRRPCAGQKFRLRDFQFPIHFHQKHGNGKGNPPACRRLRQLRGHGSAVERHRTPYFIPLPFRRAGQDNVFGFPRHHAAADHLKPRFRLPYLNAFRGLRQLGKVRRSFQRDNQRRNTFPAAHPLPDGSILKIAPGIHARQLKLLNLTCRLILAEAHVQHSAVHGGGRLAEGVRRHMRIGHVQARLLSCLRIRHAHHAPEKLFHVYAGTDIRHGAEHIGKGTVPAFFQGFHGNHIVHRTVAAENIQRVQFPLLTCGNSYFRRRNIVIQQKPLQLVHGAALVLLLRLEQNQRADVPFVFRGKSCQRLPCLHRPQHRLFP